MNDIVTSWRIFIRSLSERSTWRDIFLTGQFSDRKDRIIYEFLIHYIHYTLHTDTIRKYGLHYYVKCLLLRIMRISLIYCPKLQDDSESITSIAIFQEHAWFYGFVNWLILLWRTNINILGNVVQQRYSSLNAEFLYKGKLLILGELLDWYFFIL